MRNTKTFVVAAVFVATLAATRRAFETRFTVIVEAVETHFLRASVEDGASLLAQRDLVGAFKPELPWTAIGLDSLGSRLGRKLSIASFYVPWGIRVEERFPEERMEDLREAGYVPMVTWEPWLVDFGTLTPPDARTRSDMALVASGRFDGYIRSWARGAVRYGHPFLLRFGHEMDNPRYFWAVPHNKASDFVAAWKHVRDIFREEGAKNAVWVWSPHKEAPDSLYPGKDEVDVIGLSLFNYGSLDKDGWRWSEDIVGPLWRGASRLEKPVLVAELGCLKGEGERSNWYKRSILDLRGRPNFYGLIFFDHPDDKTLPGHSIDWSLERDPETMEALRSELRAPGR
jgi:hypothetical protein